MKPWLELSRSEKDAAVAGLLGTGLSHAEIAAQVGAPCKNAIAVSVYRLRHPEVASQDDLIAMRDNRERIIIPLLKQGLSSGQIAKRLGITRGSAVGTIYRAQKRGVDMPALPNKAKGGRGSTPSPKKPGTDRIKKSRVPGVMAEPRKLKPTGALSYNIHVKMEGRLHAQKTPFTPTAFECRSVPLLDLKRGECRWPVNDAAKGEMHLFCGNAAEGVYCRPHFIRSIGIGTQGERSAHRVSRMVQAA